MREPTLQNKTVLTAAQILTLSSAPVLLIPGKAGCLIELNSVYFRYLHGSVPFNPAASDVLMMFTGASDAACLNPINGVIATGFVDQSVDMAAWMAPTLSEANNSNSATGARPLSDVLGQGLYLFQFDSSGIFPAGANWTLGNGSLVVFLRWSYMKIGG